MSEGTRRIAAPVLAALAALALLVAVVAGYANDAFFDSDEFAERATAALDDEAVRAEVATRVTDDIVLDADADLVAFRPLIESVVDGARRRQRLPERLPRRRRRPPPHRSSSRTRTRSP